MPPCCSALRLFTCALLLAALPGCLSAQSNEGQNFWFSFLEHRDVGQNAMVVMITSKYNTTGVVRMPYNNWQMGFSVAANNVTVIQLPASAENTESEVLTRKGVQVETQLPASVYIHQFHSMRSEATMVLPVESLGQEYYALSYIGYQDNQSVYPSEFLIVGVEDDTEITVRVSDQTAGGKSAGDTFTVMLDAGETYQVQARQGNDDLSGSYLKGNKKFTVLAGCRWIPLPTGCNFRDNLLEQMYPVSTWGKQFVTAPHAYMPYDVFRILASENNTTVNIKGQTASQITLNAGEFYEYKRSEPTYITANRPIAVAQYIIGSSCTGHPVGDPSMLMLNSVEQFRDTVTLYNSSFENITENYINLILRSQDIDVTSFDGALLTSLTAVQTVAGNPDFSYARLSVSAGAHTVISGGCGVIASAYGYGDVESYAYGGGASFKPINAASLIPEGGCLNDTILFKTGFKPPRHTLAWDFGDGATGAEPDFAHVYTALGDYTVTLYLTDNCLNLLDTITRTIRVSLRQAATVSGNQEGCPGETITLSAEDLPGARYAWTGPDNFFSDQQYPVLSNAQPDMSGTYTVTGIISGCATYPASAEVVVHSLPQPFLGSDTLVCSDESFPLTILNPGAFVRYEWQDQSQAPVFTVLEEGQYWVLVTDEHGCRNSDSITVRDICPTRYYIPNIFSPNDDGINDYFSVFGSDMTGLQLRIYDRWGSLVFESNALNAQWDGRYQNKPQNPGVYVWTARIDGFLKDGTPFSTVESGSVTLVR